MTFLDKLKEVNPVYIDHCSENELKCCLFGCPYSHGLERRRTCPPPEEMDYAKYGISCIACWHREYHEKKEAEPELTINLKEEKKMKNIGELIASKVQDVANSGKIEEYIQDIVEDMDLDSEIDDLIETEIRENIDDYIGPVISEAVRDAVRSALEDLFN